jgi:peptidoglycan/LPS O-acetylase OafA/YrhL
MADPALAPAHATSSSRPHLVPLDGIRGIAILMVICSHVFESDIDHHGLLVRIIGQVFYYGSFGVDLFFVLSGFLITGILVDTVHDPHYFRTFYARRTLRIFPLYYGVLLLALVLTPSLHLHWGSMGALYWLYLQNLRPAIAMSFTLGGPFALYHFWSLAVEEQFYLVWPTIVRLVPAPQRLLRVTLYGALLALVARFVLVLSGASLFALHVTTALRADSLLLGGALALLYRSPAWERVSQLARPVALSMGALIVSSIIWLEPLLANRPVAWSLWHAALRYSVLAIGFGALIAWSLQPGTHLRRLCEQAWLRRFGTYSYGLYVLHVFLMVELNTRVRNLLALRLHNKLVAVLGGAAISLLAAYIAAALSYRFYEQPFLRLKRYFDYGPASNNRSRA